MHYLEMGFKCSSNHSPLNCAFSIVCSHDSSTVQSGKLLCEGRSRWQCCHLLGSSCWSRLWLHCHSEVTRWNCYWWALPLLFTYCITLSCNCTIFTILHSALACSFIGMLLWPLKSTATHSLLSYLCSCKSHNSIYNYSDPGHKLITTNYPMHLSCQRWTCRPWRQVECDSYPGT